MFHSGYAFGTDVKNYKANKIITAHFENFSFQKFNCLI